MQNNNFVYVLYSSDILINHGIKIIQLLLLYHQQNLMPSAQGTAPGKGDPDIPLTSSTPIPTPTSVV